MKEMLTLLHESLIENPKEMILAVLTFVAAFAMYYFAMAIFN
jgi:hypothetical protein